MNDERYKQIMETLGMPHNVPLYSALNQVANEVAQPLKAENERLLADVAALVRAARKAIAAADRIYYARDQLADCLCEVGGLDGLDSAIEQLHELTVGMP